VIRLAIGQAFARRRCGGRASATDAANSSTPFPYSVFHLYVSTLSGRVNVRSNDPDLLAMKIHALFAPLRLALERGRRPFSR